MQTIFKLIKLKGYGCIKSMIILWSSIKPHSILAWAQTLHPAWQCGTCDWITTARTMESSRSESKQQTCDATGGLTREVAFPSATTLWRTPYLQSTIMCIIYIYIYYLILHAGSCILLYLCTMRVVFPICLEYFWHLLWAVAVSIGTPQRPSWESSRFMQSEKRTTPRSNKVDFRFQIFQLDHVGSIWCINRDKHNKKIQKELLAHATCALQSRLIWRPGARSESSATVAGRIPICLSIRVESLFLETSIDDFLSACWYPWALFDSKQHGPKQNWNSVFHVAMRFMVQSRWWNRHSIKESAYFLEKDSLRIE